MAPEARPKAETDFTKDTKVLDEDYKQNNLSPEKLQRSNEPTFIAADNQKKDSEVKAQELTTQQRTDETKKIASTQSSSSKAINGVYNGMLTKNSNINNASLKSQKDKSAEEKAIRLHVSTELDKIFNRANGKVLSYFKAIDDYINGIFTLSINMALDKFSGRVADLLDDNTGFLNNISAAVTGDELLSEGEIFEIARKEFINDMDTPINNLVNTIDVYMNLTLSAINLGNQEKDTFWKSQDTKTQKIAGDIKEDSDTKFADLESSVEAKEGAIIDTVMEKFSEALKDLDDRFEKAKIENMSWLDKAIAAVKAVINTIIELANAIKAVAIKAAKYAGEIIDDPITFFSNLADAVGQGFTNFKTNIDKHLIKGVLDWLTGSLAGSDIILPKEFNLEGITSLVLQILGISIKKIKDIVIGIIGKERFAFIEKGVENAISAGNKILNIFKILNEKGLAGLWEFIKEEFGNLKEMLIENVKTFVIETISTKAIEFLLKLLIPGAAFIEAAQKLIAFVVTLFQKAAQIVKIIDGIIDSFGDILHKNLAAATKKVESVFAGFLSLAISFLAAVLGLNGIVDKVKKFIQNKIRPLVDKVLNKVAQKIKTIVEKIGLLKLIDKSIVALEKGEAWVDEKKKKATDTAKKYGEKLLKFLGFRRAFKIGTENHALQFDEKSGDPKFMVHSYPTKYQTFIDNVKLKDEIKRPEAKQLGVKVDDKLSHYKTETEDPKRKKWADELVGDVNNVAVFIENNAEIGEDESKVPSIITYRGTNEKGFGTGVEAKQLSLNNIVGQETGEQGDDGGLTSEYDKIKQNKGKYVRGHLLNAKLGGLVNNTNLTPITRVTNREHLNFVERNAKKIVTGKAKANDSHTKNGLAYYKVEVIYGSHHRKLAGLGQRQQDIANLEQTEGMVPIALSVHLKKLKLEDRKVVDDTSVAPIEGSILSRLPESVET